MTTNLKTARPVARSAASAAGRMRSASATPELASFGETFQAVTSGTSCGVGETVPLVSTSTLQRRSAAAVSRGRSARAWSSGSPPVMTSMSTPIASTVSVTAAASTRRSSSSGRKRCQSQV